MNVDIKHYKRDDEKSEIVIRYIMDYNDWKLAFSEYLERYDKGE